MTRTVADIAVPPKAHESDSDEVLISEFQSVISRRRRVIISSSVFLAAALIIGWQVASVTVSETYWISSPVLVIERLVEWVSTGYIWRHIGVTLFETGLGFLIGATLSLILGLTLGMFNTLYRILLPFFTALYSLPKVTLGPLLILYFGIGLQMKVVLAALVAFLLVFFTTIDAVRMVDRDLISVVKVAGASRLDLVRTTLFPAALGGILTGMRIAIPYTLQAALFGEILAANVGLGYVIQSSASQFDVTGVFSGLVVVLIVALTLSQGVNWFEGKTQAWRA